MSDRHGTKNLYVISTSGGEAVALTKGKTPIQTFRWSPDSQKIAFVMSDEEPIVNKPVEYKTDTATNRLWLIRLGELEAKVITPKSYYVRGGGDFGSKNEEFDWSPDGKTIVFSYAPASGFDHYHLDASLALVDLATGFVTSWPKENSYEAQPKFSPNGEWVAYITSDNTATYLYDRYVAIRSCKGDKYQRLAATFNEGPYLAGPSLLGWSKDESRLVFFEPKGTKFHLCFLPVNGNPSIELATSDRYFDTPSLSPDRTMLGIVIQDPSLPPEVYVTPLDSFQPKQLTQLNEHFLSFPMPKTEIVKWTSTDGKEIEGLLTYPIGYELEKCYPLLLVVHGGPMGFFTEKFIGAPSPYPLASFADEGFLILRPNPRGSTGYGKAFRAANMNDWGGGDYDDLMSGVDSLISRGIVNPEQMGVMGWSYGGFMTAWIITQNAQFKAASMGAGPVNLISMSGTTDLHRLISDYFGDWKYKTLYENRSPISFVDDVKTPCLIQHGTSDLRVPISQAYEFYHALDRQGKNPVLMIYPDTSHYFEKPQMELQGMEKNLEWFKKHLINR